MEELDIHGVRNYAKVRAYAICLDRLLQGAADLWVMTPFESLGKPFVEFTPASIADIRERVEAAIPGTGEPQG